MNKNTLIAVLGLAVVGLLVAVAFLLGERTKTTGPVVNHPAIEQPNGLSPGASSSADEAQDGTVSRQNPTDSKPGPDVSPDDSDAEQSSETKGMGFSLEEPAPVSSSPDGKGDTRDEVKDSASSPVQTEPPSLKPLPTEVTRELPPIGEGADTRLPPVDLPQGITTLFEASGKGTLASGGGAGDVSFYYLMKTVATSTIEEKKEFGSGKIRVQEIRSFSEATEIMAVSNVNLRVDLSTLPLDAIENTGYILGAVASLFDPALGADIAYNVADLRDTLDSFDGADVKPAFDLLKKCGIDPERIIAEPVEQYLKDLLDEVHSHVNAVQGKSYRFIYWTDKAGEPLRVRYENVDRSPISLEEQSVLNYVNLFIDCHVLPDKNCRPGKSWTIDPRSIGSMFGAVADGTCAGEVRIRRGNDLPDGNWSLSVDPATISFYREDNTPVGNVKLGGGKGVGDGRRAILRELQIDGTGKLRKKDSDTYLWIYEFITKTEGDCQFRSTISPRRED